MPQHLDLGDDDDEMQTISEALGAEKLCVEGCSTFLKGAIKLDFLPFLFLLLIKIILTLRSTEHDFQPFWS